jgi:hypothetical protein
MHSISNVPLKERIQAGVDAFYKAHGPCCAGCDWWRWYNSLAGDCTRSAPVASAERLAMLGIIGSSLAPEAGHVITRRDHVCGEFQDAPDNPIAKEKP